MKKINLFSYIIVGALMLSCEQDILVQKPAPVEPIVGAPGSASFTKFVAVGNSLTAGFQAGALFASGQNESLPRIMARQFEYAGGSATFNQPTITSNNGCYNASGGCTFGRLVLFDADGTGTAKTPSPTPSGAPGVPAPYNTTAADHALALSPFTGDKSSLNNFGVPGILLGQALIPATGGPAAGNPAYNPYYARFASNPSVNGSTGSTIIGDAVAALANGGSFFLFDLGNNDVLGYATGGGSNPAIFTSVANFTGQYGAAIDALLSVPNVKGVVGNIPNVTSIPFFKLVAYNAIPLDAATATQLNGGFAGYNQVLDALKGAPFNLPASVVDSRKISFVEGKNNKIVIGDESVPTFKPYFDGMYGAGAMTLAQRNALIPYEQVRQTTSDDLITLSAGAILGTTVGGNPLAINGLTVPLGDQYVLIPTEKTEILDRITAFNAAIAAKVAASNNRIALADVNAEFTAFASAGTMQMSGITLTASISPPYAAFSEDGVHPNGRGYAFMANIFIKAINAKFGSTVPEADVSKYKGTQLPLNP
jgi:hypothetical protein